MTVTTTDVLAGLVDESTDYERRQVAHDSDSAAERLAGTAVRKHTAARHECKGGTYLACLSRNHRRDRHHAGYLLSMILPDPEISMATGSDYKESTSTGWYSMTKGEAAQLKQRGSMG